MVSTPYISIAPLDGFIVVRKMPNKAEAVHRSIGQQLPLGYLAALISTDSTSAVDCDTRPTVPNTTESVAPPPACDFRGLLSLRRRQRSRKDKNKRSEWSEQVPAHMV